MDTQKHTNLTGKRNDEVAPVRLDRDALAAYPENSVLHAESPRGCRTFEGGHKGENMQFIDAIEGLAQQDLGYSAILNLKLNRLPVAPAEADQAVPGSSEESATE